MFEPSLSPTDSEEVEEGKRDTKHAPALLEGPRVDEEGTDMIEVGASFKMASCRTTVLRAQLAVHLVQYSLEHI